MRFGQHRPKLLRRSLQVVNSKWSKNMLVCVLVGNYVVCHSDLALDSRRGCVVFLCESGFSFVPKSTQSACNASWKRRLSAMRHANGKRI